MKLLISIFCLILTSLAVADEPLVFSPYAKSIHLSNTSDGKAASFKGSVKITGMLLVDFERDEAYFFPDEKSKAKLPTVTQGYLPKDADSIWIGKGSRILNQVLSKQAMIKLLGSQSFQSGATITIKNFRTRITCDSREYEADLVSASLRPKETEVIQAGYGC